MARKRVKANHGAPDVDGITIEQFPDHTRPLWAGIREPLLAGAYQPSPVRRKLPLINLVQVNPRFSTPNRKPTGRQTPFPVGPVYTLSIDFTVDSFKSNQMDEGPLKSKKLYVSR